MSLSRLRSLIVLCTLTVIAITAVIWAITRDSQDSGSAAERAGCGRPPVTIPKPQHAKVKVLNATDRSGLASDVKAALEKRGFTVVGVDNADTTISGPAAVRFGPKGIGAAQLVRAEVPHAESIPDDIKTDVVELILGPSYNALTPAGRVSQALKKLGKPTPPAPTCGL